MGIFTALNFQLCSAKLTGALLIVSSSTVALVLVTKHYRKLAYASSVHIILLQFSIIHRFKRIISR